MKISNVKLIVFDFDGVMTDNRVIINEHGEESVIVNRADGLGINMLREHGFSMIILSTEENCVVEARARKLKLNVLQGINDKAVALRDYCAHNKIGLDSVLYVGNDINDFAVMEIVGIRVAPADAHNDIKNIADINLKTLGGRGVVRELADILLSMEMR